MISYRAQALWELCRQGYPNSADEAETRWDAGELFHPDERVRLPRMLRVMIERCNDEVASASQDENH
jgi:hypothetical protein